MKEILEKIQKAKEESVWNTVGKDSEERILQRGMITES